jgi:hypothetical protein
MILDLTTLDAAARIWLQALGRAAWEGGIALGVAWGLCRLLPRLPGTLQCWLWRLAYLRLLTTLLLPAPLALPLLPAEGSLRSGSPPIRSPEPRAQSRLMRPSFSFSGCSAPAGGRTASSRTAGIRGGCAPARGAFGRRGCSPISGCSHDASGSAACPCPCSWRLRSSAARCSRGRRGLPSFYRRWRGIASHGQSFA